jgi:cell division transport system permease protein
MRWLLDHQSAFSEAMKRTRDRMTQFIVVICLLGVLLAIPGWLGQIWLGMASLVPSEAVQSEALVFLDRELDLEARIELERGLEDQSVIDAITFIPKSEALDALSASDGLSQMTVLRDDNPLPDALRVRFTLIGDEAGEAALIDVLRSDQRVMSLRYYPSARVQYASLVETLGLLGLGLSSLTILGVLMAVFLVSAADVVDDRRRIELYTLLGASNGFIKRPYLYRATLLGLLSGLVACVVIFGLNTVLSSVLASNLEALDPELGSIPMDGRILMTVAVIAVVASWIGAERAVHRRLHALH